MIPMTDCDCLLQCLVRTTDSVPSMICVLVMALILYVCDVYDLCLAVIVISSR